MTWNFFLAPLAKSEPRQSVFHHCPPTSNKSLKNCNLISCYCLGTAPPVGAFGQARRNPNDFFIPNSPHSDASLFHYRKVVFSHLISGWRGWAEDATRERLPSWISPTEIERSEPSVMFDALFIAHCSSHRSFHLLFISTVKEKEMKKGGGCFFSVLSHPSHSVTSSDSSASPKLLDSDA